MNWRYYVGALLVVPTLPVLYIHGKRIRAQVPKLPEAEGPHGICQMNDGNDELKLICIGESTIAGVGVKTHSEGFAGTLASELSKQLSTTVAWKVYAESGLTANDVVKKVLPTIKSEKADLIVIGLGGNDAFTLNRPEKWTKSIENIITILRQRYPLTPIFFTNMPPIKAFPAFTPLVKMVLGNLVELLGDTLEKTVAKVPDVYYYSHRRTLEDWVSRLGIDAHPADFFSNGVHPSPLTYQTWAKDMARFILDQNIAKSFLKGSSIDKT